MVSILFTQKNSIYNSLGVDCWDIERNALLFPGGNSIVAHPPCRAWGRLRSFSKPRPGEKELAVKSIEFIRLYGGVLEHPAGSLLWREMSLPLGKEIDDFGGFTISVNQSWFGHKCKKNTWLYICGLSRSSVPQFPLSFDLIEYSIGGSSRSSSKNRLKDISKKDREATPLLFALWLIQVAKLCNKK